MNRAKIIWSSIFLAIGVIHILLSLAIWSSLLLLWGPSHVQAQQSTGSALFMPSFSFLVMAWSAASGLSGRVLRVCFALGIISLIVSTVLEMASKIELRTGEFITWAAWGLIAGSVLVLFYKVHYGINGRGKTPVASSRGS